MALAFFQGVSSTEGLHFVEWAFFVVHFVFDIQPEQPRLRALTNATLELDEELDDEDVLEVELDEPEVEVFQAGELLYSSSSSKFEGSDPPLGS